MSTTGDKDDDDSKSVVSSHSSPSSDVSPSHHSSDKPADPLMGKVKAVQDAIFNRSPFCHGKIDGDDLVLYYGKDDSVRRIDFDDHTIAQLEELANACSAAKFGLNQQDVLDETYRKAGKMDSDNFLISFSPYESRIIRIIQNELLDDEDADVRAELYKLNVYGPGSFFKTHKDTPRGEKMFGSLVIILPTAYEGGELVLRDRGEEWKLGASTQLISPDSDSDSDSNNPQKMKYIAFYGDVDHEVLEVTSGYRITITYNLYYDTRFARSTTSKKAWSVLQNAFERLLDDPTSMPNGGHLGFGLTRSYPVNNQTSLYSILLDLKGADSSLLYACTQLSLNINTCLVFQPEPDHYGEPYSSILLGHPPELPIHSDMFYSDYGYSILGFVLNVELDECDSRGPPERVVRKQGSDPTQDGSDEEDENIDPRRIHIFWSRN
ncbi:hypothetical protein C8Q75DRAFT_149016 [Abortiporus biennis]|nr:hypothetical protein C8Q75DRAFT_149016 [Abortiporus biennis]